ncbi:hypothetical protein AHMF7605_02765 [Adhaeribacter arboris]|uniref:Uncharacterized protein n=1 Tax=Adhaeribacter arboris TaxID=2072846 RepID=A0A2T2YAG2_9BACT|nr:hypothetical protein AHMF7605_02765 [Adhaeribacter arboris]
MFFGPLLKSALVFFTFCYRLYFFILYYKKCKAKFNMKIITTPFANNPMTWATILSLEFVFLIAAFIKSTNNQITPISVNTKPKINEAGGV